MEALYPRRVRVVAALRKYPDGLRERVIGMVQDAKG